MDVNPLILIALFFYFQTFKQLLDLFENENENKNGSVQFMYGNQWR